MAQGWKVRDTLKQDADGTMHARAQGAGERPSDAAIGLTVQACGLGITLVRVILIGEGERTL